MLSWVEYEEKSYNLGIWSLFPFLFVDSTDSISYFDDKA